MHGLLPSLPAARSLQGSANKLALSTASKGGCPETLQLSCSFKIQTSKRAGTWPSALHKRKTCVAQATSASRIRWAATWCALPLAELHLRKSRQTLKAVSR